MGERRLCTAEVRGSNPLGSTHKLAANSGKYYIAKNCGGGPVQQQNSNAGDLLSNSLLALLYFL